MEAVQVALCLAVLFCSGQGHGEFGSNYLMNTGRLIQLLKDASFQEPNTPTSVSASDLLRRIQGSIVQTNSLSGVKVRALDVLDKFAAGSVGTDVVSPTCLNHTEILLEGLNYTDQWALRMLDAAGKPPSGLMDLNLQWLGSYDECVAVQAVVYEDPVNKTDPLSYPYTGRYCTVSYVVSSQPSMTGTAAMALTVGLCVPSSCSSEDIAALIDRGVHFLPFNTSTLPQPTVVCQLESLDLDARAIVAIVVCSILGVFIVLGTAYDIVLTQWRAPEEPDSRVQAGSPGYKTFSSTGSENQAGSVHVADGNSLLDPGAEGESSPLIPNPAVATKQFPGVIGRQPGRIGKALLAFSVYNNASKILNTNQTSGSLTAVHGVRFFSMSWVILGHSIAFGLAYGDNLMPYAQQMLKRWTFQAVANATFSVDSFFLLSGLLVAFLSMKELKKAGGVGRFNWGMFYFHRFWRLTPPYMLFLMFYSTLLRYWANGPLWPQHGIQNDECENTWWRNLLYINNLFRDENMCMGWGWYLANDMQFYIVSPLLLIPLYYSPLIGGLVAMAFLLICFISAGVISANNDYPANFLAAGNKTIDYEFDVYFKPYTRIGPYVIGILAGYILYRTDCKLRIPKVLNLAGWAVAAGVALTVLYGLYDPDDNSVSHLSRDVSALYIATSRTAWGVSLAWVIVACATGHGGFVNRLLSWSIFVPLGRLTYCAYLVHPVVMYVYYMSRRTTLHFYDLEIVYQYLAHMCVSYAVAFCFSLAFEAPMMGLEKAVLGRRKQS